MKQLILKVIGSILLVPLIAVIIEKFLSYIGIYKPPHPWSLWFGVVVIICAIAAGPIWELALKKHSSKTDESQAKELDVIYKVVTGAFSGLLGAALFIRFLIHRTTVANSNTPVLGKEMLLGVLAPLVLFFIAAWFFTSLKPKNKDKLS